MGGKGSFIVLLVIVAVLTLALAVLAGYLFFVTGTPQNTNKVSQSQAAAAQTPKRPSSSELASKKLFEEKKFFNLKSVDDKNPVIQIRAELIYFKKVKGIKNVEQKIANYESKIKEVIGTYFQQSTLEQVKDPGFKTKAREDLKKELNDLLSSDEKKQYDIIYDVVFEDWFYQ